MPHKKSYKDSVDESLKESTIRLGHKYIKEIEDGPLIHQLLINKLRANLGDTANVTDLRSPFYRKPEVVITNEVKVVEPEIDELNKVLLIRAPLIEKESYEKTEMRKQILNKEFLPVIAAMNTAVSKEMFNWFVASADEDSIKKFISELESLKNK
jgi:hypothetical protein